MFSILRSFLQKIFIALFLCSLLGVFALGGLFFYFSRDLPHILSPSDYKPAQISQIYATGDPGNPIKIGEFFATERRQVVPYEAFPNFLIQAFLAAEDDQFFEHPGINLLSIIRAGFANLRAGHVVQGGSTITQQVAKSLLLTPEKSYDRKIKEILLAREMERNLTKQEILFLYLNQIYFGRGAYGVASASQIYFKKKIQDLSLAEAALLAGLPQAPSKYNPLNNPKRAKERQTYVLRRMRENQWISREELKTALNEAIPLFLEDSLNLQYSPYTVENLRRTLLEKYGESQLYEGGLKIFTGISPQASLFATESIRKGLHQMDRRLGYRGILNHLASEKEIQNFLEKEHTRILEKKFKHRLLHPEGTLKLAEHPRFFESNLLSVNEIYSAVVLSQSPQKLDIQIGKIKKTLSPKELRWTQLPIDSFKRGDVLSVSLETASSETLSITQEPLVQAALLCFDLKTGQVLAMVGGYDFKNSQFNRVTQALRQMGSAFKPIVYASALEHGFTASSILVDSPLVFKTQESEFTWKPENYSKKFYGDTPFRQALILSRNIPTLQIAKKIQVSNLIQYTKQLGMPGPFQPDLSIALGSSSISVWNLAKTYALFPRLGKRIEPFLIQEIQDFEGHSLEKNPPPPPFPTPEFLNTLASTPSLNPPAPFFPSYPLPEDPDQVLDPRVAAVMTHLMKQVIESGTGARAKQLGRLLAGKTGTSNESTDAWFIGFTPEILTAVWVGFDQQKGMGKSEDGTKSALPIWMNFMQQYLSFRESQGLPQIENFTIPPGVTFARVHRVTGKLVPEGAPFGVEEAFIAGTEPPFEGTGTTLGADSSVDFFKEDRDPDR